MSYKEAIQLFEDKQLRAVWKPVIRKNRTTEKKLFDSKQ